MFLINIKDNIQYTILTVTEGTVLITPSKTINVGCIVVSGGGGGGDNYGGSGGGGVVTLPSLTPKIITAYNTYTLTVGDGGGPGANGTMSTFSGSDMETVGVAAGQANTSTANSSYFSGYPTLNSGGGGKNLGRVVTVTAVSIFLLVSAPNAVLAKRLLAWIKKVPATP